MMNLMFLFLLLATVAKAANEGGEFDDYYDENVVIDKSKPLFPSLMDLNVLPECQKGCTNQMSETLTAAIKIGNHLERYESVCTKYNRTTDCINALEGCSNRRMYDVATSGLKYMCVEQKEAFEETIECIDASASGVTMECNNRCQTTSTFARWAVTSGIFQPSPDGKSNAFAKLSPDFLRGVVSDGCEMMKCNLKCMKALFNQKCASNAGTLLSETFVRPIAEGQVANSFSAFTGVMGMFIPPQCSFMMNEHELKDFRIDPNLDEALKKASSRNEMGVGNELEVVEAVIENIEPIDSKKTPITEEDYKADIF